MFVKTKCVNCYTQRINTTTNVELEHISSLHELIFVLKVENIKYKSTRRKYIDICLKDVL